VITARRIVLILPCCIGDVVLATATLQALRRGFPDAHITWAVGRWSKAAIADHPLLNDILDTGDRALPVESPAAIWHFARQLREGRYDLLVSLVRSPRMSAAALLSRIPARAGLDSGGRGFGYTIRAKINPDAIRHEAEIYLDVPRALGIDTTGCRANVPVQEDSRQRVRDRLKERCVNGRYLVLNPSGGRNPGMTFDAKRYPPDQLAALGERLAARYQAQIVLLGGKDDAPLIAAVNDHLEITAPSFAGDLSFPDMAALAHDSLIYVGNDTGLTHYAAAAGAKTVMIMGPTDPRRYAPYTDNSIALWKPASVSERGVSAGATAWDWSRDGISVVEAVERVAGFVG
jgi:ADP-heptose:LPS heptosyltransferase